VAAGGRGSVPQIDRQGGLVGRWFVSSLLIAFSSLACRHAFSCCVVCQCWVGVTHYADKHVWIKEYRNNDEVVAAVMGSCHLAVRLTTCHS